MCPIFGSTKQTNHEMSKSDNKICIKCHSVPKTLNKSPVFRTEYLQTRGE